jgi:hypothetical protein
MANFGNIQSNLAMGAGQSVRRKTGDNDFEVFRGIEYGFAAATFKSPPSEKGVYHAFGYYKAPATDVTLTQASATQTYGTANIAYAAHAFLVAKAAGTASGGTGAVTIVISGTSITSGGVRQSGDTEVLVADITALSAHLYKESTKMWIGTITYTITPGATGHTAYSCQFNYGLASNFHFAEQAVNISQFEVTGRSGGNDTGFNVQLLLHKGNNADDWTYSAAAFAPGGTVICAMATDFVTEKNLANGERFHYHRKLLNYAVDGLNGQGVTVRITTGANNAVESSDIRIYYNKTS